MGAVIINDLVAEHVSDTIKTEVPKIGSYIKKHEKQIEKKIRNEIRKESNRLNNIFNTVESWF